MVWFALSFQEQVEKYGVYVGIASFFGLALLSVLYFSQARELKRLREWAGRAPERARELEQRVVAQATATVARRAPQPPAAPGKPAGAIAPARRLAEMPAPQGQSTELVDERARRGGARHQRQRPRAAVRGRRARGRGRRDRERRHARGRGGRGDAGGGRRARRGRGGGAPGAEAEERRERAARRRAGRGAPAPAPARRPRSTARSTRPGSTTSTSRASTTSSRRPTTSRPSPSRA